MNPQSYVFSKNMRKKISVYRMDVFCIVLALLTYFLRFFVCFSCLFLIIETNEPRHEIINNVVSVQV